MKDIQFAFRKLRQSPAFSSIAIVTLALGIGLNTAIFSLVNDLFLRSLPFKEPSRLIHLYSGDKSRDLVDFPFSAPRFQHYRDGQTICESLAGENFFAFTLTGIGDPVQIFGGRLTANYFDVLGVHPILGRNFLKEEEEGADVALITKRFWQKRMGGDPNVVGRSITLDGTAHTIVGVLPDMPARWFGANPFAAEVWTTKPFQIPGFSFERMMRGTSFLRVVGRLKPNVTLEQARAALTSLEQSYRTQYPNKIDSSLTTTLKTLPQDVTENIRAGFITLFAAVCFVLLIACSNVANLLLVRFSGRRREIALRMAIGASRASVVRLFVFESLLVSVFAGVAGAFIAWRLVPLVPVMAANFLPLEANTVTSLSVPVLLFTIGLSILTGLLMGIYPALQGSHADLVDGLKEGGRGTSGSMRQQRFRKILVGAQVALSVTLLAGAALLITSFVRLSQQSLGFQPHRLWTGGITLPTSQYPDIPSRQRLAEQFLSALRDTPGIETATIGDVPLANGNRTLYARGDRDVPPMEQRASAPGHDIAPDYFKTWTVPLLAGREFNEHDVADGQMVCLISQAGAKKVFPGENPIGKTLLVTSAAVPCEIVGIVGDVRSIKVNEPPGMEFYRPWAQENFPFLSVTVRTSLQLDAATKAVQSALSKVNPGLAVAAPQTMDTVVAQALGQARLMTWLLGIFAGVALLLAAIGIYGAVAYSVEQRTGEIGVRMALGAQTRDVLRLVVNQGMRPVVIGLVIGIVAAFALGRLIASQLFEVSAHDPALLGGATVLLAAIALLACLLPARRATLVDPVQALRTE
jgi:putative ABC transport system permease protein